MVTRYHVEYERAGQEHHEFASHLRPFWSWRPAQRLDPWVHSKPLAGSAECLSLEAYPALEGAPPFPASCFDVGAVRIGTDGSPWDARLSSWGVMEWGPMVRAAPKPEAKAKSGPELVGKTLDVWWPLDEAWYPAQVLKFDKKTEKHKARYIEDGVVEFLDLAVEVWRLSAESITKVEKPAPTPKEKKHISKLKIKVKIASPP